MRDIWVTFAAIAVGVAVFMIFLTWLDRRE